MRVTIRGIAQELSLSPATVSRALNQRSDPFISDATRQRVLAVAEEMGYRPNRAARALVTGRTHIIGLWMNGVAHQPFYARIIHQVQQQASLCQYEVLIGSFAHHLEPATDQGHDTWSMDGILAMDCPDKVAALVQSGGLTPTPIVSMGAYHSRLTDWVGVDLTPGVAEAVEHLVSIGCRRIAYLAPAFEEAFEETVGHIGARRQVYDACLAKRAWSPEYILAADNCRAITRQAVRGHVAAHGCPDGIFCYNDDMAIGACRALWDLGLRIPQDVALIGCDGIEDMEYMEPTLSTIVQPTEEMCTLAWQFLQNRLATPNLPPQQAMLPARLVQRASSCPREQNPVAQQ